MTPWRSEERGFNHRLGRFSINNLWLGGIFWWPFGSGKNGLHTMLCHGFAYRAWEPGALRARALTNLNMVAKASGPESVLMEGTESET